MIDARLKSYVDRIERLRESRKELLDDERDLFTEVKSAGFDTKALRRVLQRRAEDPAKLSELDAMIEVYEAALAGKNRTVEAIRGGASIRAAAKAGGVSVGTAAALAKGVQNGVRIEHNPETGEIEPPGSPWIVPGEISDADDCERATIAALIVGNPPIGNERPLQGPGPAQGAAPRDGAAPHQSEAGASARKDEDSREPGVSAFPPRPAVCNPASDTPHGLTPVGNASGLSQVADLEMPAFLRRC